MEHKSNARDTISSRILKYHFGLPKKLDVLPREIEILYPYDSSEVRMAMQAFYDKYYSDNRERISLWGINPGRFGAGITGIPFTDPVLLESVCGIENAFDKRHELSSIYVYEIIEAFGGPQSFYEHIYITSISPLGFTLDGKNFNYYDRKDVAEALEEFITQHVLDQLDLRIRRDVALCWGKGKNADYFKKWNKRHQAFGEIVELPHPRWVMQYRRKKKEHFADAFINTIQALNR